jgi:hypothetical protein
MSAWFKKSNSLRPEGSGYSLRVVAALVAVALLVYQTIQVEAAGAMIICAATWVVLLHILIGEYVFVRYLHAVSRIQKALDLLAFILLLAAIASVSATALWCAFMAGIFALATAKYLLVERSIDNPALRRYAKEKIVMESPSVLLFTLLALFINYDREGVTVRAIEIVLLVLALLFAIWMIGIRHIYRRVASAAREDKRRL